MKKKKKKQSSEIEFLAMMERAKIQGAMLKSKQEDISIYNLPFQ